VIPASVLVRPPPKTSASSLARAFIDQHHHAYGVEPICEVMQVAPSGYWRHAAQQRNPALRCARVQRDDKLSLDIERVWQANRQVYEADKVWRQDIGKSYSRPYVSDDNPYSEAQFKTMKYQPGFPARFGSLADARARCAQFFAWYNQQHCHSGIGMMTSESVHTGRAAKIRK
jgi:hypothetical protein